VTNHPDPEPSLPAEVPEGTTGGRATRRQRATGHGRRRRRRVLVAILAAVGLVVLAGVGYLVNLNRIVSGNVRQDDLMPGSQATASDGTVISVPVPTRAAEAKNSLNFLILGSDSRGAGDQGRSDVIILAHISDNRQSITLVHFPRDLYVDIPGHGKNKINAAYAYGGVKLLVQTMQQLIDVPIDHVALIDFEGFKDMTDAIGGVDVTVAEGSPGFPRGVMHMNGTQGLAFVRERYTLSQGDISRGQRQQAFLKAVLLKGLARETLLNPVRLSQFVDAATRNLTVDKGLDVGQMRELAFSLREVRPGDVSFVTAPWTGVGTSPAGASIVLVSQPQLAVLASALRTDSMAGYTDPVSPKSGFGN
jgi:LCP family protein required for cell wall assembly